MEPTEPAGSTQTGDGDGKQQQADADFSRGGMARIDGAQANGAPRDWMIKIPAAECTHLEETETLGSTRCSSHRSACPIKRDFADTGVTSDDTCMYTIPDSHADVADADVTGASDWLESDGPCIERHCSERAGSERPGIERACSERTGSGRLSVGKSNSLTRRISNHSCCSSLQSVLHLWQAPCLVTDVDADILRGTDVYNAMAGCGVAFGSDRDAKDEYKKSFPSKKIHDFISHPWAAGRIGKFIALCFVYNSCAATVATVSLAFVLLALQSDALFGVLPYPQVPCPTVPRGCWAQILCPPVFFLVLFCWHELPAGLLRRRRTVFVDKLCVDQCDPRRKTEAILGLGAFLRHADRIVILWAPQYFTRLWCAYELATWIALQKDISSVALRPIALSVLILIEVAYHSCIALGVHFSAVAEVPRAGVLIVVLAQPFITHYVRHIVRELLALPSQIQDFVLDDARCFCCSNDHRMPGTGESIPCDRAIVYRTIRKWFAEQGDDEAYGSERPLRNFEATLRETVGPYFVNLASPTRLPLKCHYISALPFFWQFVDSLVVFHTPAAAYPTMARQLLLYACLVPIAIQTQLWMCAKVEKICGPVENRFADVVLTVGIAYGKFLPSYVLVFLMEVFEGDHVFFLLACMCNLLVFLAVFAGRWCDMVIN